MARRGLVDDVLDLGLRLSWKQCLAAAVLRAIVLEGAAALLVTAAVPANVSGLGVVVGRNLLGTICHLLGFVVPTALVFAAAISLLRAHQWLFNVARPHLSAELCRLVEQDFA